MKIKRLYATAGKSPFSINREQGMSSVCKMTSHPKVYKMAAIGCMERGSRQEGSQKSDHDGPRVLDFVRKNGINRFNLRSDKSNVCTNSDKVILDNLCKLNGSMRNGTFTKPTTPALRSRGERIPSTPESPRRKRRLSKQEKIESNQS